MNIIDAATATVDDYPGGARSLAPRIPKGESTLCHEVADSHGAKLGIRTAARIVKLTGDTRVMHAFAEECGFVGMFVRMESVPMDGASMQRMADVVRESADAVSSFVRSLDGDGAVTRNERDEIMRELGEAHAALQRLGECAEALYQAGQPHLKVVGS